MSTSKATRYRHDKFIKDCPNKPCYYPIEEADNKEENKKSEIIYMQNVDPGFVGCKGT